MKYMTGSALLALFGCAELGWPSQDVDERTFVPNNDEENRLDQQIRIWRASRGQRETLKDVPPQAEPPVDPKKKDQDPEYKPPDFPFFNDKDDAPPPLGPEPSPGVTPQNFTPSYAPTYPQQYPYSYYGYYNGFWPSWGGWGGWGGALGLYSPSLGVREFHSHGTGLSTFQFVPGGGNVHIHRP